MFQTTSLLKPLFAFIILFSFCVPVSRGQIELTFGAGTSHFLGDLGGKAIRGTNDISDLDLPSTRYALSGGVRMFLSNNIAFRTSLAYARVRGSDEFTNNVERRGRNMSFFSPIVEGSAVFEIHIGRSGRSKRDKSGSLYVFGGVGMFYFEPKAELNGEILKLRTLGTEGQYYRDDLEPYKNTSVNIPFGVGYRFKVGTGYLGIEVNTRKNFTDYIDDVSTVYPDRARLFASNGAKAVEWVNRAVSTIPGFDSPGAIRGNPRNMDGFFFLLIKYDHPLSSGGDYGFGSGRRGGRGGFKFNKGKCWEF